MPTTSPTSNASSTPAEPPVPGLPELPEVSQHLIKPTEPATGRVVRNEICTASHKAAGFIRHVSIDVSGSPLAGSFVPGQSFGIIPPGEDARGRPHKLRLYSIASPTAGEDGSGSVIATTCKRLINEDWESRKLFLGACSNYLCDLAEGDEVQVTGPAGKRFILPADRSKHDYVFLATGTGIAPFRAMLLDLLEGAHGLASPESRITLVMGSPYASDLLYHEKLLELAEQHERFTYLPTLSRQPQLDGGPTMYVGDRLAAGTALAETLASERTLVYVCGIAGMELGLFRSMAASLRPEVLNQYLRIDDEVAGDPQAWERRMVNRTIRPTKRVFLEVY